MIKVSVIVPVYNVAKYLPRCLESISRQTLKEIEIIAVDDGSTDGSGKLLDDWAKHEPRLRVIHQPNAGAGAARNAGLDVATGEYLFFFDPDDTASRRMLAGMYARAKKTDADIVVAGKAIVDGRTNRMIAKFGFVKSIWALPQPFSGQDAAKHIFTFAKSVPWDKLFRRNFVVRENLRFQELPRSNDVYFVDMALALAQRIALVPHAYYRYHLNREGSLQTEKARCPAAFVESYGKLANDLAGKDVLSVFRHSFARAFFATALMNFRELKGREGFEDCYRAVRGKLADWNRLGWMTERDFSEKSLKTEYRTILSNETPEPVMVLLSKHGIDYGVDTRTGFKSRLKNFARCAVPLWFRENLKRLTARRRAVNPESPAAIDLTVDFISVTPSEMKIEYSRTGLAEGETMFPEKLKWTCGEAEGVVEQGPVFVRKSDGVGKRSWLYGRRDSVTLRIPSAAGVAKVSILLGQMPISWRKIDFGDFAPLTGRCAASFFRSHGWIVRRSGVDLELVRDVFPERLRSRIRLFGRLVCHPHVDAIKAGLIWLAVCALKALKRRPLWIVSDRRDRADDNGRALFEYIMSLPEDGRRPDCRFAISRRCADWAEMRRIGKTVDMDGWWYKLLFLTADAVVSAYRAPEQRMPFRPGIVAYLRQAFSSGYRFVFLRHGICEKDISHVMCRQKIDLMLLMTSARGEFLDVQRPVYGYKSDQVRLCGMPRYDKLTDDRQGWITFMPTFRGYLMSDLHSNTLLSSERFRETPFYGCYHSVFSDRDFIASCQRAGFKIRIMMHPNMRGALGELGIDGQIEILPSDTSYREVFATSDLVVTDYSSVAFDFAYLKKPVVYYQFDYDDYYGVQYRTSPYFEYARDGFGEIETEPVSLKKRVLEYAAGGCRMKDAYVRRVDDFYAFTDKGNCKRVYEAIQGKIRSYRGVS